ncbi:MAG: hypothetical protein HY049_01915 [Acidobacteria bacterium]|nr:hypothetical protein [Acidobacteriota bacterium]
MLDKRIRVLITAVAVATFSGALSSSAEPPQAERPQELAQGIRDLNRSIQEIASLLREQLKKQQTDLLMKRVDIKERALSARETELRGATAERNGLGDALKGIQARSEQLGEEIGREERPGARKPDSESSRERAGLDLQEKLFKDKLAAAEQRVSELENDVARYRDEIRTWEELVDSQLGLR